MVKVGGGPAVCLGAGGKLGREEGESGKNWRRESPLYAQRLTGYGRAVVGAHVKLAAPPVAVAATHAQPTSSSAKRIRSAGRHRSCPPHLRDSLAGLCTTSPSGGQPAVVLCLHRRIAADSNIRVLLSATCPRQLLHPHRPHRTRPSHLHLPCPPHVCSPSRIAGAALVSVPSCCALWSHGRARVQRGLLDRLLRDRGRARDYRAE
jgi:hypothetical protein